MTGWTNAPWFLPLLAALVLLVAALIWKHFFGRRTPLEEALADISVERIEHLVVPSADEGEIQVDQLVIAFLVQALAPQGFDDALDCVDQLIARFAGLRLLDA